MPLYTLQQAIEEALRNTKRHALHGNGFGIVCRPKIFTYGRLCEPASFSKISVSA